MLIVVLINDFSLQFIVQMQQIIFYGREDKYQLSKVISCTTEIVCSRGITLPKRRDKLPKDIG